MLLRRKAEHDFLLRTEIKTPPLSGVDITNMNMFRDGSYRRQFHTELFEDGRQACSFGGFDNPG